MISKTRQDCGHVSAKDIGKNMKTKHIHAKTILVKSTQARLPKDYNESPDVNSEKSPIKSTDFGVYFKPIKLEHKNSRKKKKPTNKITISILRILF